MSLGPRRSLMNKARKGPFFVPSVIGISCVWTTKGSTMGTHTEMLWLAQNWETMLFPSVSLHKEVGEHRAQVFLKESPLQNEELSVRTPFLTLRSFHQLHTACLSLDSSSSAVHSLSWAPWGQGCASSYWVPGFQHRGLLTADLLMKALRDEHTYYWKHNVFLYL